MHSSSIISTGNYFGKGCKYLKAQFETDCSGVEDRTEPTLVFCDNEFNLSIVEGNCNSKDCPLKKK